VEQLKGKYGLEAQVSAPVRDIGNVDTWKLKVQTRPGRGDLPAQRINIDVCSIPSYMPQPVLLINLYGVDMGTSGQRTRFLGRAREAHQGFGGDLVANAE
jgi:hypothetical protein